ncbi:hypothetical protein D9757_009928 [Collybiopsis confluens]|uniref:AB hydrolase-1 domain-containing protein n=1 Tax=Collybiopsis confluens TaxID=2823264 RepID=A0A8H5LWS3_9AGAR|nr:hypothetical protein D9757_009928 [Collybiopsis confluens]
MNRIRFYYQDSGAPSGNNNYLTFFIVHGHTYHSNLFLPVLLVGKSRGHRVILVNRREYSGSTPYTAEELAVFANGPDDARYKQLINDGAYLSLLLNGLIQSLSLPKRVSIVGWSLGNIFTLPMVASITTLPEDVRARLALHVKRTIIWDAPSHPMGIRKDAYIPLWDETLPPEERGKEFMKWLTNYFSHSKLSERNFDTLNKREHDPSRKRTFEDLPTEELFKIIHLPPGSKCDTPLCEPPFANVENKVVTEALFDPKVRQIWGDMKVWHMVGDNNPWNIIFCWWTLEAEVKKAKSQEPAIHFTINNGANHFHTICYAG